MAKSLAIIFLAIVAFAAGAMYIKFTGCDCVFKVSGQDINSSELSIASQCQTLYNHSVSVTDESATDMHNDTELVAESSRTNQITKNDSTTCGVNCHCIVTYGENNLIDATLPMVENPDCNSLKDYQCNESACKTLCKQFVLKHFGDDK